MKPCINFKKTIFSAVILSALFFIPAVSFSADTKIESKIISPFDVLQVKIPGLDALVKSDEAQVNCYGEGKDKVCEYPWIGIYAKAIYNFAVGISGILAVIVMMAGGYLWLFAGGNASRVAQAKELIGGAVLGLTLALGSYAILNLINPEILTLKALRIGNIPVIELEIDGDTAVSVDLGTLDANVLSIGLPIKGDLNAIVNSSVGKVTYGIATKDSDVKRGCLGKGNILQENGKRTICFDCSGFAYYVLKAAYGKIIPGGTANIFSGQGKLFQGSATFVRKDDISKINDAAQRETLLNRYSEEIEKLNALPAGTLVGWTPADYSKGGHVLISMGDGRFAESHGGSGRTLGNGARIVGADSVYVYRNYLRIYSP